VDGRRRIHLVDGNKLLDVNHPSVLALEGLQLLVGDATYSSLANSKLRTSSSRGTITLQTGQ
jgi:hypothetical protein